MRRADQAERLPSTDGSEGLSVEDELERITKVSEAPKLSLVTGNKETAPTTEAPASEVATMVGHSVTAATVIGVRQAEHVVFTYGDQDHMGG